MKFTNGFTSWMETFYEFTSLIEGMRSEEKNPHPIINNIQETQGTVGFYELAQELTNKFEKKFKDHEWDGQFYDEVNNYFMEHLTAGLVAAKLSEPEPKKDKEEIVKFLLDKNCSGPDSIFAFFPNNKFNSRTNLYCSYAHLGQHSACHIEYAELCKEATKKQYSDLAKEMEGMGYKLKILNKK